MLHIIILPNHINFVLELSHFSLSNQCLAWQLPLLPTPKIAGIFFQLWKRLEQDHMVIASLVIRTHCHSLKRSEHSDHGFLDLL